MGIRKAVLIVDDSFVNKIFKKDIHGKRDVNLILDYCMYYSLKLQTIQEIISKYIPKDQIKQ